MHKALPRRKALLTLCLSAAALAFALLAQPSPAAAESPWWHLTSGTRPAYLHAGAGKPAIPGEDEVQEITAPLEELSGPTGIFALEVGTSKLGIFASDRPPPKTNSRL